MYVFFLLSLRNLHSQTRVWVKKGWRCEIISQKRPVSCCTESLHADCKHSSAPRLSCVSSRPVRPWGLHSASDGGDALSPKLCDTGAGVCNWPGSRVIMELAGCSAIWRRGRTQRDSLERRLKITVLGPLVSCLFEIAKGRVWCNGLKNKTVIQTRERGGGWLID